MRPIFYNGLYDVALDERRNTGWNEVSLPDKPALPSSGAKRYSLSVQ